MVIRFKSDAHRAMYHSMLYEQIRRNILQRFGGMRQHECRILRLDCCKQFIKAWADNVLDRMPEDPKAQEVYVARETSQVPSAVLSTSLTKRLIKENPSLEWFIQRLNDPQTHVPQPYFPSVLRNNLPQFPFNPAFIDKAKALYGLLKFPFYSVTDSVYAKPDENFKGLKEPGVTIEDAPVENMATTNSIYAPSEMETGLYNVK